LGRLGCPEAAAGDRPPVHGAHGGVSVAKVGGRVPIGDPRAADLSGPAVDGLHGKDCQGSNGSWEGKPDRRIGYTDLLAGRGVAISMAAVGKPEEIGFAERLMRSIREEEIDLTEYRDFAEAHGQLGRFLDEVYNRKRIHPSLGYLTPVESEQ
jgi:hypothetical protein